jgi:hypothetical protein
MKTRFSFALVAAALAIITVLTLSTSALAKGPARPVALASAGQDAGRGPMWDHAWSGSQNSLVAVAARELGMSQADLIAALHDKTIAEVAREKGVGTDTIVNAFLAPRVVVLQAAVDAGHLTQAQADQRLTTMKANVTAQLNSQWMPRGAGIGPGFVDQNHDGICDYRQ